MSKSTKKTVYLSKNNHVLEKALKTKNAVQLTKITGIQNKSPPMNVIENATVQHLNAFYARFILMVHMAPHPATFSEQNMLS